MKRARAVRLTWWCVLGVLGCSRLAGLDGDYKLGSGGVGASSQGGTKPSGGGVGTFAGAEARGGGGQASTGAPGAGGESALGGDGAGGFAGDGGASRPLHIGHSEFHDSASGNDNASSHLADASFALPSGTRVGDLLLVFFGADHSLGNLSGSSLDAMHWILLDQHSDYGTDGQAAYLIYKIADGSEPDPIVFPGINETPSGNGVQGLLSVYRGVSKVDAYEFDVLKTGESEVAQATTPTPAITTHVDDCLLIAGLSPDTTIDVPVVSSWPEGFVEHQLSVVNPRNPYPLGWANIYSAERYLARAGTVPASAFVWSTGDQQQYFGSFAFVLALAP
jgi:hypothetical protein